MTPQTAVKQFIKNSRKKIFGDGSDRIKKKQEEDELLTENLAFRIALEIIT